METSQSASPTAGPFIGLPHELLDSMNQIFFLHRLATEPEKVVPPGKTLLSMMIHSQMNSENEKKKPENLLEQVQEAAHRAFWNEVRFSAQISGRHNRMIVVHWPI